VKAPRRGRAKTRRVTASDDDDDDDDRAMTQTDYGSKTGRVRRRGARSFLSGRASARRRKMIDRSLDKSCENSLLRSELIELILDLESCEIGNAKAGNMERCHFFILLRMLNDCIWSD